MTQKTITLGKKKFLIHTYENGKINGLVEVFNDKDIKLYEFTMENGKINGPITMQNGNKVTTVDKLSADGMEGAVNIKEFDKDNILAKHTHVENFKDGKFNKKVIIDDVKKKEKFTGEYNIGVLNGPFTQITKKQTITGHYVDGQKHGDLITVKKGQIIKTNFKQGVLHGPVNIQSPHSSVGVKAKDGIIKPPSKFIFMIKYIISLIIGIFRFIGSIIYSVLNGVLFKNIKLIWKGIKYVCTNIKNLIKKIVK